MFTEPQALYSSALHLVHQVLCDCCDFCARGQFLEIFRSWTTIEHDKSCAMHENNCSAELDHRRQLWRTTCGCGQERGSLSLFQLDSVANGGERRIYWLDCPEDHRQQYCHCLYCRAQIIARHFERRRVYCRPEQETRRPAGANIGPGVIKEAAFHL